MSTKLLFGALRRNGVVIQEDTSNYNESILKTDIYESGTETINIAVFEKNQTRMRLICFQRICM